MGKKAAKLAHEKANRMSHRCVARLYSPNAKGTGLRSRMVTIPQSSCPRAH